MTDRMSTERVDSQIREFLAWQSNDVSSAPTASEVAARISSHAGASFAGLRLMPQLAWLLLFALLIAALVSAAVIGASLLRRSPLQAERASNGWIAVSANDGVPGEFGDIYLLGNGAPARLIIGRADDGVAQACPRFSPDGQQIAYGEGRQSLQPGDDPLRGRASVSERTLVVVGLNDHGDASAQLTRVTLPTDGGEIACPEWSPDGKRLALRVGAELWVVDPNSVQETVFPVIKAPWGQQAFEWSRDGRRIAVAEPGHIRVVPVDGRTATLFALSAVTTPGSLGWTAGDERIIYTTTDEPGDAHAINVIGAEGDNDTQLTPETAEAHTIVDFNQVVPSPDGTWIAYVSVVIRCSADESGCAADPAQLLIMDVDGSDVREVVVPPDSGAGGGLQWSPDGQRLLLGSIDGIVSVAVAPGSPAIVHSSGELDMEWSSSELTWQPIYP